MTKVLIVDDSALMRRLLGNLLQSAGFDVETARNGREGVERLTEWQPDVVTLDINMPEMDGLTALSLMMQARPTPVVMVSSLTAKGAQATFEALALGAVDFIAKPGGTISLSVEDIARDLIAKVQSASRARMRAPGSVARRNLVEPASRLAPLNRTRERSTSDVRSAPPTRSVAGSAQQVPGLVLVGVSTGGPRTLEDILPALPREFPWPVLVAQHMPANFTDAFAQRMGRACQLAVCEVRQPIPLEPGMIYIAKGGTDMVVAERLGRLVAMPVSETPGHPWHPSVDVMVDSAMRWMPAGRLVGVQLTGMGNDGAAAMTRLRQQGGRTIAESEETAVVFGMPQDLIQRGGASVVLPCHGVANQLQQWIR